MYFASVYTVRVSALHASFSELTAPSPFSFDDVAPPIGRQVLHFYLFFDFPPDQSIIQVWWSHRL